MADYDRDEESICYICCKILWMSDKKRNFASLNGVLGFWWDIRLCLPKSDVQALSYAKIIEGFGSCTIKQALQRIANDRWNDREKYLNLDTFKIEATTKADNIEYINDISAYETYKKNKKIIFN